jgi:hypothetical protein
MYGLEKKPGEKFAFDLEKEMKDNPNRAQEILKKVETRIHEMKKLLREGASDKDFDRLGVLLHGYSALQKVLKKIAK